MVYVVKDVFLTFQVSKMFLEVFESPEIQGVIFFQTVVNHVSEINLIFSVLNHT